MDVNHIPSLKRLFRYGLQPLHPFKFAAPESGFKHRSADSHSRRLGNGQPRLGGETTQEVQNFRIYFFFVTTEFATSFITEDAESIRRFSVP
jgi:hypothetical protein